MVYVNPPYGRKIKPWVQKCVNEAKRAKEESNDTEIILLGPARTDTQFFQKLVCPTASPALFPSFLAYWGPRPALFEQAFTGMGWFISRTP
jgi:hypothetical protein